MKNKTTIIVIIGLILGYIVGWALDTNYKQVRKEMITIIMAGEEIENPGFWQIIVAGRELASGGVPYGQPDKIASKAIVVAAIVAVLIALVGEKYRYRWAVLIGIVIILFEWWTFGLGILGFKTLESSVAWGGGALGGLIAVLVSFVWMIANTRESVDKSLD